MTVKGARLVVFHLCMFVSMILGLVYVFKDQWAPAAFWQASAVLYQLWINEEK